MEKENVMLNIDRQTIRQKFPSYAKAKMRRLFVHCPNSCGGLRYAQVARN